MRLTKHRTVRFLGFSQREASEQFIADIYEKLMHLEDIEEEFGIDLVTLFKALKNGIYKKDEDLCFKATLRIYNEQYQLCQPFDEHLLHIVQTKDYGKTWALTKEELE